MALVSCPECSKRISESAENCPNCGFPVNPIKQVKPKGEGCFLQTLNIGCFVIIAIFVFALILAAVTGLTKFNSSAKKAKTELRTK